MTKYPADLKLGDALARYYAEAGLPPDGGESQAWAWLKIGPLRLPFPNPPVRKRAVIYHDAHHVLKGYDTVFTRGEMIIAAYEVRAGCGRVWIAWVINLWMFFLGLLFTPRAMFQAFADARGCSSLYRRQEAPVALKEQTLGELRRSLGLDAEPREADGTDRALFFLWAVVACLVVAGTIGAVVLLAFGAFRAVAWILE